MTETITKYLFTITMKSGDKVEQVFDTYKGGADWVFGQISKIKTYDYKVLKVKIRESE